MRMDSLKKYEATILAPEEEYSQNRHSVELHTKLVPSVHRKQKIMTSDFEIF